MGGAAAAPGGTIGPWRLVRRLGSGGMGEVWLAERDDGAGAPRVALKLLHWDLRSNPPFVERFLREGAIGARVRHPNVAATLEVASHAIGEEVWHCIALEYVEGRTLREVLDAAGRLPEALCRRVGLDVARGLAAIHAAGAIHRDVKPENVLITTDHEVKLTDFGVARSADDADRLSSHGSFAGTILYAAPEQFRTRDLDGRADLFALGCVLFELACGAHPFAAGADSVTNVPQLVEDAPPLAALAPQATPFLEAFCATLLDRDRAHRFPSAREAVAVLEAGEAGVWWRNRLRAAERGETRQPLRRPRVAWETPFAGREGELDVLRAAWSQARAGAARVAVAVEGAEGSGRSRLVAEFAGEVERAGFAADAVACDGRLLLVTTPGAESTLALGVVDAGAGSSADPVRVVLRPLARADAERLVAAVAPDVDAAAIAAHGGGHPLRTLQLARAVCEGAVDAASPPASVEDVVRARLAALGDDDRGLLRAAAALGDPFDAEPLAAARGLHVVPVLERLAGLERRHGLVRAVGTRFVFDHAVVRRAAAGTGAREPRDPAPPRNS